MFRTRGRTIAVIGLGLMGRPLSRVLAESGLDVRGWNRSPLPRELAEGLRIVGLEEAAEEAEVLALVLYDSEAVAAVLALLEPRLRPGQLVVDLGTSRPSDSVERARRLAAAGVGWVDAPVSGGPEGILERRLAIMAGGSEEDVERARPVLEPVGKVVRVGGPGAGHAAKLVNQVIVPLTIEAVAEALALGERLGLDLELVREALAGGSADSRVLRVQGSRMIAHAYTPGARASLLAKDLRLISEVAATVGLELPHVASTLTRYEELIARGEGDLDCSALHRLLLDGREAPGGSG